MKKMARTIENRAGHCLRSIATVGLRVVPDRLAVNHDSGPPRIQIHVARALCRFAVEAEHIRGNRSYSGHIHGRNSALLHPRIRERIAPRSIEALPNTLPRTAELSNSLGPTSSVGR